MACFALRTQIPTNLQEIISFKSKSKVYSVDAQFPTNRYYLLALPKMKAVTYKNNNKKNDYKLEYNQSSEVNSSKTIQWEKIAFLRFERCHCWASSFLMPLVQRNDCKLPPCSLALEIQISLRYQYCGSWKSHIQMHVRFEPLRSFNSIECFQWSTKGTCFWQDSQSLASR